MCLKHLLFCAASSSDSAHHTRSVLETRAPGSIPTRPTTKSAVSFHPVYSWSSVTYTVACFENDPATPWPLTGKTRCTSNGCDITEEPTCPLNNNTKFIQDMLCVNTHFHAFVSAALAALKFWTLFRQPSKCLVFQLSTCSGGIATNPWSWPNPLLA